MGGECGETAWHAADDSQEPLREVDWPEALAFFIKRFNDAWARGHQNLACYNSGQLMLEEFYTLAKLWRGGPRSSNIDGNTRLCTASAATALTATFGTDARRAIGQTAFFVH